MKKTIISSLALALAFAAGAQTQRDLVVIDNEGNKTTIPGNLVENVRFEPAPDYSPLVDVVLLGYQEYSDYGVYHLELGNAPADEEGYPKNVGDLQVAININGPKCEEILNPELPAGYYRPGNGKDVMTFDVTNSALWLRTSEGVGNEGVSPLLFLDGTVDVRRDGENYDLRFELVTNEGSVDLRYQGPLPFPAGVADFTPFDEDVDLQFMGAQGRFYGNWTYPFAADLFTDFYKGTIVDGSFNDGYWLHLDFCEPKPADCMAPNQRIADGTYTAEQRESIYEYSYLPFRYNKGQWVEIMAVQYMVGSYILYIDPNGQRKLGFITDGTFTVSGNGTKVEFDLVTAEGKHVRGSYSNAPYLENFCDNDVKEPKRPFSSLTSDVNLSWATGTAAVFYNWGKAIADDANLFTLLVTSPSSDKGDYLQFDLFCNAETIENGTYTVGTNMKANEVLPGTVDYGGSPSFSWYCNYDRVDPDGYLLDLAPVYGGSFTVSDADGGKKKLVFNLTDDNGNKITGEYTGTLIDATDYPEAAPAAKLRRRH